MKTVALMLALMLCAAYVYAANPIEVRLSELVEAPPPTPDSYVQPPHTYWWTINASSGFGSWLIDDIPDDLYCTYITGIDFYVCVWGGAWRDPLGVQVVFYPCECPPDCVPFRTVYFPWDDLMKVVVYEDPAAMTIYYCAGCLCDCQHIEDDMSIGFQVDNGWGTIEPYCGIVMTDDNVVYGDCEGWWDGSYWGYVGYVSGYFVTAADVAYSLVYQYDPTSAKGTTWSQIKALYD